MKITDPQVIKQGEKDLIESVQEDLDLDAVREILKERMSVAALSSKGGQIVVHNNEIAFRLDFEINLGGSLLFDRDGNFIDNAPAAEKGSYDAAPLVQDREEEILLDQALDDDDLDDGLDDDEDLSIDLPNYGLADEPQEAVQMDAPDQDVDLNIDGELELAAAELSLEDEDSEFLDEEGIDLEDDEDDPDFEAAIDDDDNPFGDDDMDSKDLDDDINDILKESREFWEQKKDS